MGSHITRAATHLPPQTVLERLQTESRPHRRQRWEIIYQALTAPREAAQIAKHCGVSKATVHQLISAYNRRGVEAVETPGKGGRRNQHLTLEQERAFLQPYLARAAQGDVATVAAIQQAFETEVKEPVAPSTIYRHLSRHGWRQRRADPRPTQSLQDKQAQRDPIPTRERRQRLPPQASRPSSSPGYPSESLRPPLGHPGAAAPARQVRRTVAYDRPAPGDRRHLVWGSHGRRVRVPCRTTSRPGRRCGAISAPGAYLGTWERIHTTLREQTRCAQGRKPTPSAAILDSQSVKTSQKGGGAATTAAKK